MLSFLMHNEITEESNRLTERNNFSPSSIKLTQVLLATEQQSERFPKKELKYPSKWL